MLNFVCEKIKSVSDRISVLGRVCYGEEGELRLPWSGCGLSMRFVGDAIFFGILPYVTASEPNASPDQRYAVVKTVIDGVSRVCCISSDTESVFATGLGAGEHILQLYKINETDEPLRIDEVRIFGEGAQVLPYKPTYSFKMEVVGDSITCGYGVWGKRPAFYACEEDATAAYAHLAAEHFGAELRLISWSGRGLAKNCDGSTDNLFCDFYTNRERRAECGEHSFDKWQAELVVINGGTNDGSGGATDEELREGIERMYSLVRSKYRQARILFFYGAMGDRYDTVYRSFVSEAYKSDKNVYYAHTEPISEQRDEIGANGHPSYIGHRRISEDLIRAISEFGFA